MTVNLITGHPEFIYHTMIKFRIGDDMFLCPYYNMGYFNVFQVLGSSILYIKENQTIDYFLEHILEKA